MLFSKIWWLSLINYVLGKTIYDDSLLNYDCQTNENCAILVPNSMCLNNKCLCQLGYRSDGRFRCVLGLRYRREIILGEECQSNDECRRTPMDGTKICSSNQCQCSSGHVPIDAYRCIREFEEQVASNTQVTTLIEIEESRGYGSLCLKNEDCQQSTHQLECLRGTCVCLEGYVPLGKYLCYNIHGQDAPIIERSTLSTTIDQRHNEIVKSLGKLGNTCTSNDECQQSVSQAHCSNGKCSCNDGYVSLDQDTCIENPNQDSTTISIHYKSLLGGKCLTNQNCHTTDARCLNHICTCPIGYFAIDHWNCLEDPDAPNPEPTTVNSPTTTVFQWWPWTLSSTTHQSLINSPNTFHFRCLLSRQCLSIDSNSHCSSLGRCVCNIGYKLEMTNKEQNCVRQRINEENCD